MPGTEILVTHVFWEKHCLPIQGNCAQIPFKQLLLYLES